MVEEILSQVIDSMDDITTHPYPPSQPELAKTKPVELILDTPLSALVDLIDFLYCSPIFSFIDFWSNFYYFFSSARFRLKLLFFFLFPVS